MRWLNLLNHYECAIMKPHSGSQQILLNRRQFILGLLASGFAPQLLASLVAEKKTQEFWVSAQGSKPGVYGLSWCQANTKRVNTVLSGFRGHGASQHPLRHAAVVMYARRPGTSAIEVNLQSGAVERTFHCAENRHFFGHGCFSRDGKTLFTTEADIQFGKGKIGIRDALTYRQIGEYESYGIGPHEVRLLPNSNTLVIANGGILTRPDTGRKKLNLDSMASSLTYIDAETGKKLGEFKVLEPKSSIRHLDVAADGTVAIAIQMQRSASSHENTVPLGAVHKPGESIRLLGEPDNLIYQMNDYMGSVAINEKFRTAGFTSPRGSLAAFWNIDDGRFLGYHQLNDVCGITVTDDQQYFVISNSFGQLRFLEASTLEENKSLRVVSDEINWDNHLMLALF